MPRLCYRNLAVAAASMLPLAAPAKGATITAAASSGPISKSAAAPATAPVPSIFDPARAPVIVIHVGSRLLILVPKASGSSTTLGSQTIGESNGQGLTSIIARNVAGAAAAPNGEIHIRGSHGQYSYYLDGAPLPTNVSGSFTDWINPKDIETLRVYTGGFPPEYGGQLAAVFDITAKAGHEPGGLLQQLVQGFSTYQTTLEYSGTTRPFPTSCLA